jgi:enoyl-CoA hydratase
MNDLLLDRPEAGLAVLRLNRPARLNALTDDTIAELGSVLDALARDDSLRALILTGEGRGFCAGFDLTLAQEAPHENTQGAAYAWTVRQEAFAGIVTKLRGLRAPVIAAVNGTANGAGLGFALACEIRLASPDAKFNAAFVKVGMSSCDIGVSWLLPRAIGMSRAFEIELTGHMVDAVEAERIGLVSKVVPSERLVDEALELGRAIAANDAFAVWMTKRGTWANAEATSLHAAIELENRTQILARSTGELARRADALVNKRRNG